MENIYKSRFLITPMKGFEENFWDFCKKAENLECGDDSDVIFEKTGVFIYNLDGDVCISPGQWIYCGQNAVSFGASASSPESLVSFAASIAKECRLSVKAVWANKINDIFDTTAWEFQRANMDEELPSFYCASMGRALFFGDEYGLFYGPQKKEKERQQEYYSLVWGKIETDGSDIDSFFAPLQPPFYEDLRDKRTYPSRTMTDEYGNKISFRAIDDVKGYIDSGIEEICALPVKKMILEGKSPSDFYDGRIVKYESAYLAAFEGKISVDSMDYLMTYAIECKDKNNEEAAFLLDKDGQRIKKLSDFDHAIGEDGEIFYPVLKSDISGGSFTESALKKWCDKLGLDPFITEGNLMLSQDRKEVIALTDKNAVSVTIPEGVTFIRSGAFMDCKLLEKVTIPESLKTIGDTVFYGCSSLKSISFPDSFEKLGNDNFIGSIGIFSGCSSLEKVNLGKSVKIVPEYAFSGCKALKSIFIPKSVEEIKINVFSSCKALTEIIVEDGNPSYCSYDGLLYSADGTKLLFCPDGRSGCVKMLESAKSMESTPFFGNDKIKKIILSPLLEKINCSSFLGDFSMCADDLELIFTDPKGWFGTDDYDAFKEMYGGKAIAPNQINEARNKYEYLYHIRLSFE